MQFNNETPFPGFVFQSFDQDDSPINVVFCRGTFSIENQQRLVIADEQEPVVLADKYRTEPLVSSVEIDTDLVPRKLAADITLNSVAHAPHGQPAADWLVEVRVGRAAHSIRVTGPRSWKSSLLFDWQLTPPQPTLSVPLHFEYAFGGKYSTRDEEIIFEQNPVGMGFADPRFADRQQLIPAPQIEYPHDPVIHFGKTYQPAGFGPIAKHWLPRRMFCGTADDKWKRERWPMRPLDFDFRYYNCASAPLVYPGFLRGDEEVVMKGISPEGDQHFQLPEVSITLFAMDDDDQITLESMKLDTFHIDTVKMRAYLTWRSTFSKTAQLDTIQLVAEPLKPIMGSPDTWNSVKARV